MEELLTPLAVLSNTLYAMGPRTKEIAAVILNDRYRINGQATPAQKAKEHASWFTQQCKKRPDELSPIYFADFAEAAAKMHTLILRDNSEAVKGSRGIVEFLLGAPKDDMAESLFHYGEDPSLFSNMVEKASQTKNASDADVATLCLLVFLTAGCTADLKETKSQAEQLMQHIAAVGFKTEMATASPQDLTRSDGPERLGLVRVENGAVDLDNCTALFEGPQGTIIGSLTTAPHAITNVSNLVSREHAKIYRDDDGTWWIEGLGSTNGTVLVRGSDRKEIVVEAPRKSRKGRRAEPVSIGIGDTIILAAHDEFYVVPAI